MNNLSTEPLINKAKQAKAVLVFAHGAGADMHHTFMNNIAEQLSAQHINVVRFNFPFMVKRAEDGKRRPPDKMDKLGNKEAKDLIAMIKIVAPNMAMRVIDRAIQILGGKGVGPDSYLAHYFAIARMLRLADGPDEVHMYQLGKSCIKKYGKI